MWSRCPNTHVLDLKRLDEDKYPIPEILKQGARIIRKQSPVIILGGRWEKKRRDAIS